MIDQIGKIYGDSCEALEFQNKEINDAKNQLKQSKEMKAAAAQEAMKNKKAKGKGAKGKPVEEPEDDKREETKEEEEVYDFDN